MLQNAMVVASRRASVSGVGGTGASEADPASPIGLLRPLAVQEVEVAPRLRHRELFTLGGLLTLVWHDAPASEAAVVACGGAMGGLLGPAEGLYHDLGTALSARGIAVVRVGYRRPGDLAACVVDVAAATDLAVRRGARRVVVVGHSFGGAVAVRVGVALPGVVAGVVTLATQSAGCEVATKLRGRPVLLVHGDADELLPVATSETVQRLAAGDLVVLAGAGHLLTQAAAELRSLLLDWIPAALVDAAAPQGREE